MTRARDDEREVEPECQWCAGTGIVEYDVSDARGEHMTESGPCMVCRSDSFDDRDVDNLFDSTDVREPDVLRSER